jgi:hypothetical protein
VALALDEEVPFFAHAAAPGLGGWNVFYSSCLLGASPSIARIGGGPSEEDPAMRPTRAALLAALLCAGCVEKPLDGAPGSERSNAITGYAPGPDWEARVQALDPRKRAFVLVPLYDTAGRPLPVLRSDASPAEESALLTPDNRDDLLYRFEGFYDLPAWAWADDRATIRVQLRPPSSTAFTAAYGYTSRAYHGCLVGEADRALDLLDLGARCSDREALTLVRSPAQRNDARRATMFTNPSGE